MKKYIIYSRFKYWLFEKHWSGWKIRQCNAKGKPTGSLLTVTKVKLFGKSLLGLSKWVDPGRIRKITDDDHIRGNRDAKVTIIEFSDFECPACGATYPILKAVMEQYGDKVRMVYQHFPLSQHPRALPAASFPPPWMA